MRQFLPALALLLMSVSIRADPLLPTAEGTEWEYQSTETRTGEAAPIVSAVTVRAGKQLFEGKEVVKLETTSNDAVSKTELILVDGAGVVCLARAGADHKMVNLIPADRVMVWPLRVGVKWDQQGEAAGIRMRQRWTVVAEETVTVPASQFQAFHLHCEDSSLMSVKLDRWFVPGIGIVKEVTAARGPGMFQRVTLELQKITLAPSKPDLPTPSPSPQPSPSPTSTPQPSPSAESGTPAPSVPSPSPAAPAATEAPQPEEKPGATPGKKLTVEVSSDPAGGLTTVYKSSVTSIYVRWHGHGLPDRARVRVAWVAEDVGDLVEPNFVVDETETIASTPDTSARFTLSRPPDGWAEGKYRVEFYVNDELTETVKVMIAK